MTVQMRQRQTTATSRSQAGGVPLLRDEIRECGTSFCTGNQFSLLMIVFRPILRLLIKRGTARGNGIVERIIGCLSVIGVGLLALIGREKKRPDGIMSCHVALDTLLWNNGGSVRLPDFPALPGNTLPLAACLSWSLGAPCSGDSRNSRIPEILSPDDNRSWLSVLKMDGFHVLDQN